MAKYDATVEVGIKPIVDEKSFDAELKKLKSMATKGVGGLGTKSGAAFESLASSLVSYLMRSGRATSSTQARLQIESVIGPTKGNVAARLRGAQNISATEYALTKGQERAFRNFEKKFSKTERGVSRFLDSPTSKGRETLLETISELESDTKELVKTYKKSGQEVPKILKDSNKTTKKWQNEVLKAKIPFSGMGFSMLFGKLLGLGTLGTGAKVLLDKTVEMTQRSVSRGDKDIDEILMYGKYRDIPLSKTYAALYQMKEEDVDTVQKQAIMWRARAMTGQLNEKEAMALSKLGLLELIQSGEAERNPWAYMAQFQKNIRSYQEQGRSDELLQYLQLAGLPANLARLGMTTFSPEQIQKVRGQYEREVANNIKSSMRTLPLRSDWQSTGELITSQVGSGVTSFLDPINWAKIPRFTKDFSKALSGNPESMVQTINNVFNLYGADPEENKEAILDIFENQNRMNVNKLLGTKGII